MKYVKLEDVQKIMDDMHSKMTAVQRPALDRFESAVKDLEVVEFPDNPGAHAMPPVSRMELARGVGDDVVLVRRFRRKCPDCGGTGRIYSRVSSYSTECNRCLGVGEL